MSYISKSITEMYGLSARQLQYILHMYAHGNIILLSSLTSCEQHIGDIVSDKICDVSKPRCLMMECLMTCVGYIYIDCQ